MPDSPDALRSITASLFKRFCELVVVSVALEQTGKRASGCERESESEQGNNRTAATPADREEREGGRET